MNKRVWLGLLLIAGTLFLPAPTATAQNHKSSVLQVDISKGSVYSPQTRSRQSHHELPGGLDLDNPQEMMAQRLQELRELHQLQDQVQGLLQDPDFLKNIQQQFSESQLQRLRDKMLKGEGLQQDPSWDALLKQAASHKKLDSHQIEALRRLTERTEHKPPSVGEPNLLNNHTPSAPPSSSSPTPAGSPTASPNAPPPAEPEPSLMDRMQQESVKWLMDHLDDIDGDMLAALAGMGATEEGTPLAELLRSVSQPDFSDLTAGDRAMGLAGYLPQVGDFLKEQRGLWNEMRSLLPESRPPSLPHLDGSSASAAAAGESAVPALLALLLLGLLVVLATRMAARKPGRTGSGEGDSWRLGPWPVAPAAVASRHDLIRAFEYLALLCLGRVAATCHHRELAQRLAEQDSGNPARRQAADMLASLYEQARYAPAGEALSEGELTDARHALCLLAGVTAA